MIKSFSVKLKTENAFDLASAVASSSGLLRELYDDKTPEGLSRYENVQELLNGIKEFVDTGRSITPPGDEEFNQDPDAIRTLDIFMQDIALLTDTDEEDKDNDDKVSLMTLHSAKGLEFPAVYVVGLEENLFPSQRSMDSREDLEEERRLFYVGITRAEKKLSISYATSRYKWGNLNTCEPSRFIEEIDPSFIEESGPLPKSNHMPFDEPVIERWNGKYNAGPARRPQSPLNQTPSNLKKIDSSAVKNFEGSDTGNIQSGMQVEHEKFGEGKVLQVEGKAGDLKATVFFQSVGTKQLLLKYAKLKIVG
jgi:DNA helicase-2/ATP-dependent DNA helicase PcrA